MYLNLFQYLVLSKVCDMKDVTFVGVVVGFWAGDRALVFNFFFFQAEDGIRDLVRSRGLGDVYKRQFKHICFFQNCR